MCENSYIDYEKYSVLMTVYKNDNPNYFNLALDSMINQTIIPNEIVLVKDGPIPAVLQNIIDKKKNISNIVEVQLEKNIGLGLALNEGIKVCKNELIARMDADDYSFPTRCEKQLQEFQKDKSLGIVGLSVKEFTDTLENIVGERKVPITNEEIYKYAKTRDPFNHPTVMYKKSELLKVGCYGDYRKNQDTDLWIKLLSNNIKCANLKEDLFRFRFDKNTYIKRKNWLNTKLLISIRYKAYKNHFCSIFDFLKVLFAQLGIFIMPLKLQEFVYRKLLRS